MHVIDLTLPISAEQHGQAVASLKEVPLVCDGEHYTGMVWHYRHDSMAGTYIDFPGHIKETLDGQTALNYPLEKLYRVRSAVIHLNRENESGAIEAEELIAACPDLSGCRALVINALGAKRFDDITLRSVYLAKSAVRWIISTGIHLLVSDVYESRTISEGVFPRLFENGISTVCYPVCLDQLTTPHVDLTVLAPRFPDVTQLPCRILAEIF
jgi:kynurenine formamidase